jgi:hypothetical protein
MVWKRGDALGMAVDISSQAYPDIHSGVGKSPRCEGFSTMGVEGLSRFRYRMPPSFHAVHVPITATTISMR